MRIVLIDDDQRLLDALVTAFRFRWPEADVLTATDADTGLSLAVEPFTDVVVLDIGLPDRNGFDLLADIRRTSDVPVVVLTAAKDETDHVRGLELGADDYLSKPFGHLALMAHIRAVLRRAKPLLEHSARTELVVGQLHLDQVHRQVVGPRGRARLTPIEFRLLYYLMRNAGHVVSRSALIRRVWGDEEGATHHDLTVFITRLRAKFGQAGDPRLIATEHAVGYYFIRA